MMTPDMMLKQRETERSLQIVPVTRGQLVQLLTQLHIAKGAKIEQARLQAEALVAQFIAELNK